MHTATLNTPRTTQSAAPSTQALTPNEGAKDGQKLVLMSWAEWAGTPKDYKIAKGTQRWVMRAHPPGGVGLFPVHITG